MRRDVDFSARVPELCRLWFDQSITGQARRLSRVMALTLENAYLCGALDAMGAAMHWADDDIRVHALDLQRQAAERLAVIRDEVRDARLQNTPLSDANHEVKRRLRNRRFDRPDGRRR